MSSLMHGLSVPVFTKSLANLSTILGKAEQFCTARKIDPSVLLAARLAPDMFALTRQVQIACDFAKGTCARLAGEEPPKFDDTEASFADLQARIERTLAYIGGLDAARFAGAETRTVELKMRDQTVQLVGLPYLAHMALPNFFFHFTTAYDILRHNGVELGKTDFIGKLW